MKVTKTITTVLLLLLLAVPLLFSVFFIVKQKIVQYRMEQQLEKQSLQTITTAAADITWVKEGKEALIEGRLFDVKNYSIKSAVITLTGLYDTAEEMIKEKIKAAGSQNNKSSASLLGFIMLQYFQQPETISLNTGWQSSSKTFAPYKEGLPEEPFIAAVHPPNI